MGSTPRCSRDSIVIAIGVTASETVQVTLDGGSSANEIFLDKAYGERSGLAVYCFCWDSLLGIGITRASYNCFVYSDCLTQKLEGQWTILGSDWGCGSVRAF